MSSTPTTATTHATHSGTGHAGTLHRVDANEALRGALASGNRPARPSAASTALTFGWRALLKIRHVPEQLFDVTAFPIMSTLMFTYLFGGALAGSVDAYLQFLLPGILVQTIVMISMYTGMGLNTDITKGMFDRFRSLPIWQPSAIVGALLGDAARYSIASALIILLGVILGYRPDGSLPEILAAIALILVFAFCLSWAWTALGLIARSPNAVLNMAMMVLFPLTFISNIFVDPDTMPRVLRAFVNVNPISLLTTAVRGLMAGNPSGSDIGLVLACSGVLLLVFAPLTMLLYRRPR
ncbi:MAG: ABC transporter permease [Thermomicrobiales bacterium]